MPLPQKTHPVIPAHRGGESKKKLDAGSKAGVTRSTVQLCHSGLDPESRSNYGTTPNKGSVEKPRDTTLDVIARGLLKNLVGRIPEFRPPRRTDGESRQFLVRGQTNAGVDFKPACRSKNLKLPAVITVWTYRCIARQPIICPGRAFAKLQRQQPRRIPNNVF